MSPHLPSAFDLPGFSAELVDELSRGFEQGEGSTFQNSQDGVLAQTRFLVDVLRRAAPRRVLETGTHKAHFCYLAALAVPGVEVDTFGIDPGSQTCVEHLTRRLGRGPIVRFHLGDSKVTLRAFVPPHQVDFAWVDGGHDFATCLSDLESCARLRVPHVCVDDYRGEPEVARAVAHFLSAGRGYSLSATSNDPRGIAYLRLEGARSAALVYCQRPAPGTWAAAVLRELAAFFEVRTCGPGWPARDVSDLDPGAVKLLLELDTGRGCRSRPTLTRELEGVPRAAWLVETSRKPELHRQVAREVEVLFHAHPAWASALGRPSLWLPLCADEETFSPRAQARECDVAFVGPDPWRADPLVAMARRLGLRAEVVTSRGEQAKAQAAAVYGRARAVFHCHLTPILDVRVLEAMAAGRVVLADRPASLEGLAEPGRHFLTWRSQAELKGLLEGLLADDARREVIEREAAALVRARHGARTRVSELVRALEDRVGPLTTRASVPEERAAAAVAELAAPRPAAEPGRWLALAGEEPEAARLASYAERLGEELRARGDEVRILRLRRGRLPAPRRQERESTREVDLGPLPDAATPENAMLLASARVQRILDQVAREQGPFRGLLAEGPLGAITGPAVAERLGLPFFLALEDCEVARRGNNLTRDQLYRAELEHWACDRARLVLVPGEAAAAAVRQHYAAKSVAITGWPLGRRPRIEPESLERLRGRLSLAPETALVRAPLLGLDDALALATGLSARGRAVVVLGQGVAVEAHGHQAQVLARGAVTGPALAALAAASAIVVHAGREDLGAADLARASRTFALVGEPTVDAVLAGFDHARPGAGLLGFDPGALTALAQVPDAPGREASAPPMAQAPALAGGGA